MKILRPSDLVTRARKFAVSAHGEQKYGDEFPYLLHLLLVEGVLLRFEVYDEEVRAIGLLHDVLEDTPRTYEELVTFFGLRVADAVAALTEPKGGNRAERHAQTYPKIFQNPDALLVKLADRIANVETGGRLVGMYFKEHAAFKAHLYHEMYETTYVYTLTIDDMWAYLDELLISLKP